MPRKPTGTLFYRICKRTFDIAFSAGCTAALAIPMACVYAAICVESPGCPVYTQERVGRGGRVIRVLKLRSMVSDAGDVQKYLSPEQLRQWEVERKVDDDPRITKVGQFIRKCSIDEVPQFLNVLKGDLSVIGPRPITRDELDQHFTDEEKEELLSVTPGITGLWQATDRIRVVCDDRDEKIGYKIREARSIDRVPYMLILGEKEVEAGNISVRDRSNETVQMSVDEFVAKVLEEIKTRA